MNRRGFLAALAAGVVAAKRVFAEATGFKHEWLEEELLPSRDVLRFAENADSPVVFPLHPERFRVGDVVHCPRTGENFSVRRITGRVVDVVRGLGSVPRAMDRGEALWILGSAEFQEGCGCAP